MSPLETARHVVAVLLMVSLPPGLALWFVIHPFARQWRRVGTAWTYGILSVPVAALMYALYAHRDRLLGTDRGGSYVLMALAALCVAGSVTIAVRRKRYLTSARLVGVPELSPASYPGELLCEGIYARIRHPRYVEILLGSAAYALFADYTGVYLLVLASVLLIHLLVLLEERELRERFGTAYEEYASRVPRYWPRSAT